MEKPYGIRICLLAIFVFSLLAGCSRGPGEASLHREIQEKLDRQVKPGLLEVVSLHRRGSSELPASENGGKRLVVYYNATLKFREAYAFGSWERLSSSSLVYILGANVKGIFGIKAQNQPGDILHVYGSSTYERSDGTWKSIASAPGAVTDPPAIGNTALPQRSKQLIDKLAMMVDLPPPGVDPSVDRIISEELDKAARGIERKLDRRKQSYTFAGGQRGGEYDRFGRVLVESLKKAGVKADIRNLETEGSIENAWLLFRGEADYALIQNDVATHAVTGKGQFGRCGPLSNLRALGSLFPEPVHIIVPSYSRILAIRDLRGKRVSIGMPNSGTQYDALAVLKSEGLRVIDLKEASQEPFEEAMNRMMQGLIDAVFVTTGAPNRTLQELSARNKIRLVPVQSRSIARLAPGNSGLIKFTLPANSYPGQTEDVSTVAATALLVATDSVPDTEVERLLTFVFSQQAFEAVGSAEGFKISRHTALQGVTIPMHPAASRFFGNKSESR